MGEILLIYGGAMLFLAIMAGSVSVAISLYKYLGVKIEHERKMLEIQRNERERDYSYLNTALPGTTSSKVNIQPSETNKKITN